MFNLRTFWEDHKARLPAHYGVYITQVGPLKAAAANVETFLSGVGKFTEEAPSTGDVLLGCIAPPLRLQVPLLAPEQQAGRRALQQEAPPEPHHPAPQQRLSLSLRPSSSGHCGSRARGQRGGWAFGGIVRASCVCVVWIAVSRNLWPVSEGDGCVRVDGTGVHLSLW